MKLSFEDACGYLFPRTGGAKTWSLGPTSRLLDEVGNPHHQFPSVHIGGTNGKGSVATLVAAACAAAGLEVGLYTSPHLVNVRERIVVGGQPISEAAFAAWTTRLHPQIEATDASFFEALTAIAFADLAARGVDIAVVEVGLGGRLDSTNVLTPLVAAVTNIGSDHQQFLGDSLEAIAREKAGIAKPGISLICGEEDPALARVIETGAAAAGAKCTRVESGGRYAGVLGLPGDYQRRNAAIAHAVLQTLPPPLRPSPAHVERAFAKARLPGRFDRRGRWLFDVAHNVEAFAALVAELERAALPRPIHGVVGVMQDKNVEAMARTLLRAVDRVWVTVPPSAPAGRAGVSEAWREETDRVVIQPAFARAMGDAQDGAGTVLVTGSFYTVGDAMASLPGFAPLG